MNIYKTMSAVFNVSGLIQKVSGNAVQNDPNQENSLHFLIVHKIDSTLLSEKIGGEAIIQEEPKITCNFNFRKSGQFLNGNVSFTGETLNIHYEISLNYINSNSEVEFLETWNASDITPDSQSSQAAYRLQSFNDTDGKLVLYCKITKKCISPIKLKIPKNEMPAQFSSLYEDNLFNDFKIICEDKEFLVHKVVLAARSPVFRAIFQNKMKESQENQVKINDFEPKIVEQMVRYIYTDNFDADLLEVDEIQKLLMIADKYELRKLQMLCMRGITNSMDSISECYRVISIIVSCNLIEFMEPILQFIKDNLNFLKNDSVR